MPVDRKEFECEAADFPTPALSGSGPGVEAISLLSAKHMGLPQRFLRYCYHHTWTLSMVMNDSVWCFVFGVWCLVESKAANISNHEQSCLCDVIPLKVPQPRSARHR